MDTSKLLGVKRLNNGVVTYHRERKKIKNNIKRICLFGDLTVTFSSYCHLPFSLLLSFFNYAWRYIMLSANTNCSYLTTFYYKATLTAVFSLEVWLTCISSLIKHFQSRYFKRFKTCIVSIHVFLLTVFSFHSFCCWISVFTCESTRLHSCWMCNKLLFEENKDYLEPWTTFILMFMHESRQIGTRTYQYSSKELLHKEII